MNNKYFGKDATSLAGRIYECVANYVANGIYVVPEPLLRICRVEHTVSVVEDDVEKHSNCDYYSIGELVIVDDKGDIQPNDDAIARLTAAYATGTN